MRTRLAAGPALLCGLGLLLVLLAAHATPTGYRGPAPTHDYHGSTRTVPPPPVPLGGGATGRTSPRVNSLPFTTIVLGIAALALVAALVLLVRRYRVSAKPARDTQTWEDELARRMTDAVDAGLLDLRSGPVDAGIVACWEQVLATAQQAGLPLRAADSPEDFALRVLRELKVRPEPLRALAQLYREARFSTHVMSEAQRDAAREALDEIRADLTGAHAVG